jgi:hypothetical protein
MAESVIATLVEPTARPARFVAAGILIAAPIAAAAMAPSNER